MHTFAVIIFAVCLKIAHSATIDPLLDQQEQNVTWMSSGQDVDISVEEKMKELRIEMVKYQILSKLNLKEAPPSVEKPSESSREMIRLLVQEEEEQQRRRSSFYDSEERLIIHAKNNSLPCVQSNQSYCKMFRYELSTNLNTSSLEIWIYKLTEYPKWISIAISYSSPDEERYYDVLYYELHEIGWNKLQMPRLGFPSSWNDTVSYLVEIIGENIQDHGDHRPFLMVSKPYFMPTRQKRDVTCDTNENCCLKPLRVSVSEIGFNWVVYPVELEVNMCIGKCSIDHSALRTHYERAMTTVLEINSTLQASLGECWALCCRPKVLEPVRVFYNDTEGIIHDQYIPELSVKSCSCF